MSYEKIKGIIIKEINYNESDKILTVLSEKEGKISVIAKGARRNKSGISAASSIMCYSEFTMYKGKGMYIINSIDIIEQFYNIRNDLGSLAFASYFLEVINDTVHENEPSGHILKLLLNCLYFIMKNDKNKLLIKAIFDFRLMAILGFAPAASECQICGGKKESYFFSFSLCGIICEDCSDHGSKGPGFFISRGTVLAINHITYSKFNDLFSFNVSNDVLNELNRISRQYVKDRMEKDYKTLSILESL